MNKYNSSLITPVLLAGSIIIIITFGIRGSFGVFQIPIENEFQWLRVEFSSSSSNPKPWMGYRSSYFWGFRRKIW